MQSHCHEGTSEPLARLAHRDAKWASWQAEVLVHLRADFQQVIQKIEHDDVDWNEWRTLYDAGHDPRAAVNRAYGRDL